MEDCKSFVIAGFIRTFLYECERQIVYVDFSAVIYYDTKVK